MDLKKITIKEAHSGLIKKEFSALELTEKHLERIKKIDEKIKAFISVNEEKARTSAKLVDDRIAKGEEVGLLAGIPAGIKDIILTKGDITTGGSKILENYEASYDATVIDYLRTEETILIGKTNCDEFAMGSSTENSGFFNTHNPWNLEKVPGGSSGGSAAAVSAGECVFALGTDTGGSIRQPAAFSGIVGLKPTYGAVSRYGAMAMASSFDQIGPMAKTVEDTALVYCAIAGPDKRDASSAKAKRQPCEVFSLEKSLSGMKAGLPKEYFGDGLDANVRKEIEATISKLKDLGATIKEVSLPNAKYALAVYYIIQPSEVSTNMARYDGIRYGKSNAVDPEYIIQNLSDLYLSNRSKGLGAEVKRRIMIGTHALSSGYYDAYYKKAQSVRQLIRKDFKKVFEEVDLLVGPTTPTTAFTIGEKSDDPMKMYLADIYTVAQNVAGVPALSIPCGLVEGLPVGMQIIGKWWDEGTILRAGYNYEQARGNFPTPEV